MRRASFMPYFTYNRVITHLVLMQFLFSIAIHLQRDWRRPHQNEPSKAEGMINAWCKCKYWWLFVRCNVVYALLRPPHSNLFATIIGPDGGVWRCYWAHPARTVEDSNLTQSVESSALNVSIKKVTKRTYNTRNPKSSQTSFQSALPSPVSTLLHTSVMILVAVSISKQHWLLKPSSSVRTHWREEPSAQEAAIIAGQVKLTKICQLTCDWQI